MKTKYSVLFILPYIVLTLIATSCDKEVDPKLLPVISTFEVVKMTESTAYCGGSITSDAGSDVVSRGVCWSESPNPNNENSKTTDAAGTGTFYSRIVGLKPNTFYYLRAYASNKKGTAYGIQVSFTTKSLSINTKPVNNIINNSVISGGTITSDGDSLGQKECGVCWSTNPKPTVDMNKLISNHKGKGEFIVNISNLQKATYYIRAYYTNTNSTFYGNEVSFSTIDSTIDNAVKTDGSLIVKATTNTYNGQYAPKHVLAIWIESNSGSFVRTLLVNAAVRKQDLTQWQSSTNGNATDAITGATMNSHTSVSCSWNGTNTTGAVVGDGLYNLCVEFTESNGMGRFAKFPFTKGKFIDNQSPAARSNISNVILTWTPASK